MRDSSFLPDVGAPIMTDEFVFRASFTPDKRPEAGDDAASPFTPLSPVPPLSQISKVFSSLYQGETRFCVLTSILGLVPIIDSKLLGKVTILAAEWQKIVNKGEAGYLQEFIDKVNKSLISGKTVQIAMKYPGSLDSSVCVKYLEGSGKTSLFPALDILSAFFPSFDVYETSYENKRTRYTDNAPPNMDFSKPNVVLVKFGDMENATTGFNTRGSFDMKAQLPEMVKRLSQQLGCRFTCGLVIIPVKGRYSHQIAVRFDNGLNVWVHDTERREKVALDAYVSQESITLESVMLITAPKGADADAVNDVVVDTFLKPPPEDAVSLASSFKDAVSLNGGK